MAKAKMLAKDLRVLYMHTAGHPESNTNATQRKKKWSGWYDAGTAWQTRKYGFQNKKIKYAELLNKLANVLENTWPTNEPLILNFSYSELSVQSQKCLKPSKLWLLSRGWGICCSHINESFASLVFHSYRYLSYHFHVYKRWQNAHHFWQHIAVVPWWQKGNFPSSIQIHLSASQLKRNRQH